MFDRAKKKRLRDAASFTPLKALETLPPVTFSPETAQKEGREFVQAELLESVLAIARLDHVTESKMVRDVVKTALGRVPEIEE